MPDFDELREDMVENQLERRDIHDERVLEAFRKVPRHEFVPEDKRGHAYSDHPLPIGSGQTISQPYMVASMTQLLELKGDEKVLEIGTGSGYQAAVLAELCEKVVSVERFEGLAGQAREKLEELGYDNVKVVVGDGTLGFEEKSPYDGIIVTAAAPEIPEPLREQLKDGGKLVIPVGSKFSQELLRIVRNGNEFRTEKYFGCRFVPLKGEHGW